MSAGQPRYIVAEVKDGAITLGWTFEVFTDPAEALGELADAHGARLTGHQVYTLAPRPAFAHTSRPGHER